MAQPQATAVEIVARGPQGQPGQSGSLGFVRYQALASTSVITLAPNTRTLVSMALDPTLTIDQLQGPFADFVFWDGTTFSVREANDSLEVRLGLQASALVAGGTLQLDAQIIGSSAPLDSQAKNLPSQAGATVRLNYELDLFSGSSFAANGLQFYLTSTVAVTVQNETVKVTPNYAGAP